MWDNTKLSFVGSFSLRKIALILMAVIMSASFIATLNSATIYADNASWGSGDSISYQNKNYGRLSSPPALPGLDSGYSEIYATQPQDGKVWVIALKKDFDPTKEIVDAKSMTFAFDDKSQTYSSPDPPQGAMITISAKSDSAQQNKTSCVVQNVGWIICGVSKFIAGGMDKIYDIIASFLSVKPVSGDTDSGLFQAWNIARGLANAMFILAFLVIIYSQITTIGISNYEVKKMIPRLVVAAVLVNISYYICGIAVDISNILGDSINKALIDLRHSLPSPMPDNIDYLNWQNMTEWIMSGGTIAAGFWAAKAAFLGAATTQGTMSSLAFLLFPILVSGALAVLVAVLVLAARQALITVLIVASPLAFVAYLLPNTEKWFERWRELFTTMLLVFPLFSLLFGGSQLASFIIIQNADQVSVVIFAMFIQVAPLFLTPFLVRFSGNMLGRLANNAHGKRKSVVDRARGWSEERAKMQAAKGAIAASQGRGTYAQRRAFKRGQDKRNREAWVRHGEAYAEAAWHNDSRYRRHHTGMNTADAWKSAGEATANRHFEEYKASAEGRPLQTLSGVKYLEEARMKALQTQDQARWSEAQAGKVNPMDPRYAGFAQEAHNAYREQRIADSNLSMAQSVQSQSFAKELSGNEQYNIDLQVRAGGIGDHGAAKVKASALQEVIEAGLKNVRAIEMASSAAPGDVPALRRAFDQAVADKDVDSLRAYTNMLAASSNVGIKELRSAIRTHEAALRQDPDVIETLRHFINGSDSINKSAEDIATWSRDASEDLARGKRAWRTLDEVSQDPATWRNMTTTSFASMKASSQQMALTVRDENGNWAISRTIARDIMKSPVAWANIKEEMKPFIRDRAMGVLDGWTDADGNPVLRASLQGRNDRIDPPAQRIDDRTIPEI